MKKLLILILTLYSFTAFGQSNQYLGNGKDTVQARSPLTLKKPVSFEPLDTNFTPNRVGILLFRGADSSWYGSISLTADKKWDRIGSNGGGTASWGNITGTLSNQTDLQAALDAKQNTITTGTTAQYFRGDLSLGNFQSDVLTVTGPLYSTIGHQHTSADISDFTTAARGAFSAGTGISIVGGVITATGSGSGADSSVFATRYYTGQTYSPLSHVHDASGITTGTLPISRGGTGLSAIGAASQMIRVNTGGTGLEYFTPPSWMTNPMTTTNDIIIGGASGVPTRFPIGLSNQVLTINASGNIEWANGAPFSGSYGSVQAGATGSGAIPGTVLQVYTGSTPITWTLPLRSTLVGGKTYYIKNAGTSTLTINTTGSDQIWTTSAASSMSLAAGESVAITTVGFYWFAYFDSKTLTNIYNIDGTLSANRTINANFKNFTINNANSITLAAEGGGDIVFNNYNSSTGISQNVKLTPTTFLWGSDTIATRAYARSVGGSGGMSQSAVSQLVSDSLAANEKTFDQKYFRLSGDTITFNEDSLSVSGSVTTDATPTDASTNPVQSNGVYDALALKADKTALADSMAVARTLTGGTKTPLDFKIGTTTNSPANGSNKIILSGSLGYEVTLKINDREMPNTNYDGIYFTKSADTVFVFGTTFTTGDRVHLNFFKSVGAVSLPSQSGGSSDQSLNLSNASPTALTETPTGTWSGNNTTGIAVKYLPAGTDGYITMDVPVQADANLVAISLDVNNSAYNTIGQLAYCAYIDAGTLMRSNASTPSSTGVTLTAGANTKIKINRSGSTVTVQYTTDGTTWNTAYTFSTTTTAALYPKFNIYGSSGTRKIVNPKGSAALQ